MFLLTVHVSSPRNLPIATPTFIEQNKFSSLYFVLVKCWALLVATVFLIVLLAIIIYLVVKGNGTFQKGKPVDFVFS